MTTSPVRAGLALAVAALALSVGHGEPPKLKSFNRPDYTAFPKLEHPRETVERKGDDGKAYKVEVVKRPARPPVPELGANPTLLRRVRHEQALNGFEYLAELDKWLSKENRPFVSAPIAEVLNETYRVCADLEPTPAKRLPWYEARVRDLKELEFYTRKRVEYGQALPNDLSRARIHRLRAEAELLELQAELEKAK